MAYLGTGYIRVQVSTGDEALPIPDAEVIIKNGGVDFFKTTTDENGRTGKYPLPAPCIGNTLDPYARSPAYSLSDVEVRANGFVSQIVRGVEIFDTQTAILPVHMEPLTEERRLVSNMTVLPARSEVPSTNSIQIPPNAQTYPGECPILQASPARSQNEVIIPDFITVHLGRPENVNARNVRVAFPEYIKNVTSSEIYATWPQQSLRANIHAIVSFALNRVYTEWYPSRGYAFDITNSTAYDQYFRQGGPIYESISVIVDEIFNVYAHRQGFKNPYFTQFCDGRTVSCPGMSQWGTVTLANQGFCALQILHHYYPKDLMLRQTDNIAGITSSFPGELRLGSEGEAVRRMQNDLNRIRANYPLIPMIWNPNGKFDHETQNAVMTFQRVFNLPQNGVVNRATWNRITNIFVAVSRLAELNGEGVRYTIGQTPPTSTLSMGSKGQDVLQMQFLMNIIAAFHPSIPFVIKDGTFGESDRRAVLEFQRTFDLPVTGNVGPLTWNRLYSVYRGIRANVNIPDAPL
jgi:peptidoglycan hydrolase-like protein with peptidoglycan-binding domain